MGRAKEPVSRGVMEVSVAEAHQVMHGFLLGQICTLMEEIESRHWNGHEYETRRKGLPEFTVEKWPAGTRVKVVSVSRFWYCGITTDLTAELGDDACVSPGILMTDNESPETAARRAECHHWYLEQREADAAFMASRRG